MYWIMVQNKVKRIFQQKLILLLELKVQENFLKREISFVEIFSCLLYTSDAADEKSVV